ncbi:hypothetical protein BDK51DRAFT_29478 [Blyttiomyces helicus]|uniref:Uncharacterized protein n=1 Tax=Blyttiomyces helicus TaxID=388810 RepID=A0A4P9WLY8_9FUNG|nr:hypothetical protein BDK51DRAFT_29478 [Blyttiomyces helicus]|eukprot:RKO93914.1 hypothetical protein BDK51DRAFT_29478 [Blyttiomyces helicus]
MGKGERRDFGGWDKEKKKKIPAAQIIPQLELPSCLFLRSSLLLGYQDGRRPSYWSSRAESGKKGKAEVDNEIDKMKPEGERGIVKSPSVLGDNVLSSVTQGSLPPQRSWLPSQGRAGKKLRNGGNHGTGPHQLNGRGGEWEERQQDKQKLVDDRGEGQSPSAIFTLLGRAASHPSDARFEQAFDRQAARHMERGRGNISGMETKKTMKNLMKKTPSLEATGTTILLAANHASSPGRQAPDHLVTPGLGMFPT